MGASGPVIEFMNPSFTVAARETPGRATQSINKAKTVFLIIILSSLELFQISGGHHSLYF
jgi:hypothetical protein